MPYRLKTPELQIKLNISRALRKKKKNLVCQLLHNVFSASSTSFKLLTNVFPSVCGTDGANTDAAQRLDRSTRRRRRKDTAQQRQQQ